jgi:hypothetical protein
VSKTTELSALTAIESERLSYCEMTISAGLGSFYEVGLAILEIRDNHLYRGTHSTFESYLNQRFSISRRRAYQLMDATKVVTEIQDVTPGENGQDLRTTVHNMPEGAIRPLTTLPEGERAEAFREASQSAGDRPPTAKEVQKAVNRRKPKPEPTPEESNVQEVLKDAREAAAERAAIKDEVSDENWVQSLPLSGELSGIRLRIFQVDALLFRAMEHDLHALRTKHVPKRRKIGQGEFRFRAINFLSTPPPNQWALCPPTEYGGCGGTGEVELIGECPRCHGRGYWIPRS